MEQWYKAYARRKPAANADAGGAIFQLRDAFHKAVWCMLTRHRARPQDAAKNALKDSTDSASVPSKLARTLQAAFGLRAEYLSSPLDSTMQMAEDWSAHGGDAELGYRHDAYSRPWRVGLVHPEHGAKAMERAARWAVMSAEASTNAVFLVLVLPHKPKTACLRWLEGNPMVHLLASIPRGGCSFSRRCTGDATVDAGAESVSPATNIFLVANPEGVLSHYLGTLTPATGSGQPSPPSRV